MTFAASTTVNVVLIILAGVAGVLVVSAAFYLVGRSEDREREAAQSLDRDREAAALLSRDRERSPRRRSHD